MKYKLNAEWIRQGDVLLRPIASRPDEKGKPIHDGVIARGEVTGHCHKLSTLEGVEHYDLGDGRQLLFVEGEGVSLVHEEHAAQILPIQDYEVVIDREFDYIAEMERTVVD